MTSSVEFPRYFAFISYSHQDQRWADWLHKALETYRVPSRLVGQTTSAGEIPRRLLPIFRDRDELASSSDLGRTVNAALTQSRNLIVICSPASARSRWVNEEVLAFKRLGGSERIFCLIVGGEPNAGDLPGREAEECFAPALRYTIDAKGQLTTERAEPIAADAREGKDGRGNARLKLIAGLLDVGFDALKQRELHRRNVRMAVITAAALVVMAITTTLAITAVIARHDAERRQKQAEDLVGFMLGDLNDKLREVKRLDILQAVDDKAMAYFASLPTKDVTDAALEQRVLALEKIGSVRADQGRLPAALESYRAASTLASELAQRSPHDVVRQAAYADSLKWIGQNLWFQGELDQALQSFRAAERILQVATAAKSSDSELAFKLGAIVNNVGHVLEARGELAEAKSNYEAMARTFETLAAREPESLRWQSYLATAQNNLGKVALQQGNLAGAVEAYRADQRIKAVLFARDSNNHDAQESLVLSNAILGRTLALCGQLPAATGFTQDAVSSARSLAAFDPDNLGWRELFGLYSQQLGRLLRQQDQLDAAADADETAVRTLEALVAASATNTDFQQELAQARLEWARLQLKRGQIAAAAQSAEAALAALAKLAEKKSGDRAVILLTAQGNLLSGTIAQARNDDGSARRHWDKARDLTSPLGNGSSDPNVLAVISSAMLLLGDRDSADQLNGRLSQMGYRDADFLELVASKGSSYPVNSDVTRSVEQAVK